jgi:hypothetical protein
MRTRPGGKRSKKRKGEKKQWNRRKKSGSDDGKTNEVGRNQEFHGCLGIPSFSSTSFSLLF